MRLLLPNPSYSRVGIIVKHLTSLTCPRSSAVGFGALTSEPNLVDALAKSSDLVTYIPSTYSTTWTAKEKADPQLGSIINFIHSGWDRAAATGIGLTPIYTGIFDVYFFEYAYADIVLPSKWRDD